VVRHRLTSIDRAVIPAFQIRVTISHGPRWFGRKSSAEDSIRIDLVSRRHLEFALCEKIGDGPTSNLYWAYFTRENVEALVENLVDNCPVPVDGLFIGPYRFEAGPVSNGVTEAVG
jgi:hypothetical protein